MEKLVQSLNEGILKLTTLLDSYPTILEIAKDWDGKIINKRFVDDLEKRGKKYAIQASYHINDSNNNHSLSIWRRDTVGEHLFQEYNVEDRWVIENKRLNYNRFVEMLGYHKAYLQSRLNKCKQDLIDGQQRLDQYNKLVEEAIKLRESFSDVFMTYKRCEMKKVY